MRFIPLLILSALLCACRGTQAYTPLDRAQVERAYAEIVPTWVQFRKAYIAMNGPEIVRLYGVERRQCRIPDQIDKRDTIDPNVNLFQASFALDSWCNDIESLYTSWAMKHHLSYQKNLVPGIPKEVLADGQLNFKHFRKWLKHPADLA